MKPLNRSTALIVRDHFPTLNREQIKRACIASDDLYFIKASADKDLIIQDRATRKDLLAMQMRPCQISIRNMACPFDERSYQLLCKYFDIIKGSMILNLKNYDKICKRHNVIVICLGHRLYVRNAKEILDN